MSAYHSALKIRQLASEELRVKSILVFAQRISRRGAKRTKDWIDARKRIAAQIQARAALDKFYGRKKGSIVK